MGLSRRAPSSTTPRFRSAAIRRSPAHSRPQSGSYILGTPDYTLIKLSKGSFTYWYSYQLPTTPPGGTASAAATGKVIKTKRVEGTVSIFNYNSPPSWHNCTSGAPLPYSATQCRRPYNRPPYIEKSLPVCWADV